MKRWNELARGLLSLVVCLCMVLSMLPVGAMAEEIEEPPTLEEPGQENETGGNGLDGLGEDDLEDAYYPTLPVTEGDEPEEIGEEEEVPPANPDEQDEENQEEPAEEPNGPTPDAEPEEPADEEYEEVTEELPTVVMSALVEEDIEVEYGSIENDLWALLYPNRGISAQSVEHTYNTLEEPEKAVYRAAKARLEEILDGKTASTVVTVSFADLFGEEMWTAQELGVSSVSASTEIQNKILEMYRKIGLSNILYALKFDCPYEFFWAYGVQGGYSSGYQIQQNSAGENCIVPTGFYSFKMKPAEEFMVDAEYTTVNAAAVQSVSGVPATVKSIVSQYAGLPDLDKLAAYRTEIHNRVTYNYDAANGEYPYEYGNPWQLIWVFDDDSNTKVVCEGYSKAFQYLCELSHFTGEVTQVYSVTGTMNGGNHMWNLVQMADTTIRLVDATNNRNRPKLFMGLPDSGDMDSGYMFDGILYVYDDDTLMMYTRDELEFRRPKDYTVFDGTHSLVLSGEIGINFFMELNGEGKNADSYMDFHVGGKTPRDTRVKFSQAEDRGNGIYSFTCRVSSIQMAEKITATYHYGENAAKTVTQEYSVIDYLELAMSMGSPLMRDLARTIYNYGSFAQQSLSVTNGWVIGQDYAEIQGYYPPLPEVSGDISAYAKTVRYGKNGTVSDVMTSLSLDSSTALNVYFRCSGEEVPTVTVNGNPATAVKQSNGEYRVTIYGISAHLLGTPYRVVINGGEAICEASALSYVHAVTNSTSARYDSKRLAAALYDYYNATMAYRGQ